MRRTIFALSSFVMMSAPMLVHGAVISVDVDPGTPGVQTTLSVVSGTTITITVNYLDGGAPTPFDLVAGDLNWTAPGLGIATAAPMTGVLHAGPVTAGPIPPAMDVVTSAPIGPGVPLTPAGVPPLPGMISFGGGGHFDAGGTYGAPVGGFLTPPGTAIDLFGETFTITGAPGDTVMFTPSGIIPGGGTAPGGPFALATGFALQLGGVPIATPFAPGMVTIVAVPEPSSVACIGIAAMVLGLRRRRRIN